MLGDGQRRVEGEVRRILTARMSEGAPPPPVAEGTTDVSWTLFFPQESSQATPSRLPIRSQEPLGSPRG